MEKGRKVETPPPPPHHHPSHFHFSGKCDTDEEPRQKSNNVAHPFLFPLLDSKANWDIGEDLKEVEKWDPDPVHFIGQCGSDEDPRKAERKVLHRNPPPPIQPSPLALL